MQNLTLYELTNLEEIRHKRLHYGFSWDLDNKVKMIESLKDCQDLIDVVAEIKEALRIKLDNLEEGE